MGSGNILNYSRTTEKLLLSHMQPFQIQPKKSTSIYVFCLNFVQKQYPSFHVYTSLNNNNQHTKASFTAMVFTEWAQVNCGTTENILNKNTTQYNTQNLVLVFRLFILRSYKTFLSCNIFTYLWVSHFICQYFTSLYSMATLLSCIVLFFFVIFRRQIHHRRDLEYDCIMSGRKIPNTIWSLQVLL